MRPAEAASLQPPPLPLLPHPLPRPPCPLCATTQIVVSALGDAEGNNKGGLVVLDGETFEVRPPAGTPLSTHSCVTLVTHTAAAGLSFAAPLASMCCAAPGRRSRAPGPRRRLSGAMVRRRPAALLLPCCCAAPLLALRMGPGRRRRPRAELDTRAAGCWTPLLLIPPSDASLLPSPTADFWYQPHHDVLVSTSWGAPAEIFKGFDPSKVESRCAARTQALMAAGGTGGTGRAGRTARRRLHPLAARLHSFPTPSAAATAPTSTSSPGRRGS